jgi:tetratricopeptide (TPR) repeat protein
MTGLQLALIAALVIPSLFVVLWPLLQRPAEALPVAERPGGERRLELEEEKAAIYRALKELDFDHEAGHLSDDDYRGLRDRYEERAAALIGELDSLPRPRAPREKTGKAPAEPVSGRLAWTRHPVAVAVGALVLLVFGVVIGINAGRFTEPDRMITPPGARLPVPGSPGVGAPPVGPPAVRLEPGKPIPPEMLAGMLQAARQSLAAGRYSEAIAAYQAVLKRDARNVDAMTHLGLIVAIGGHADSALEAFDKALQIDPKYAPAHLYRGQVLYEKKQDYAGAVKSWERFLALVPRGEDHDRVAALVKTVRDKQPPR